MINNLIRPVIQVMLKGFFLQLAIFYAISVLNLTAQDEPPELNEKGDDPHKSDLSLFGSDEILNVTLLLDLASFPKKTSKSNSFESEMTIHLPDNDSVSRKVTIGYRGVSRYELCRFPPMQITFKKPVYSDSLKIKKLKLVTHCQSSYINNEYVLREYLVYKMFNVLTDTSFRVRLLRVTYVDSKMHKKSVTKFGIFLEPAWMVARRTNSVVIKTGPLKQSNIIPFMMDRVAIFNYMVSNWDWSIPGQHNVEVIKPLDNNQDELQIAIPFDFDLTGVVNADYAIPPPDLNIANVRVPIFNGICRTREVYMEDLKRFLESKEKLYSVVNEFPHINKASKKDITVFLDQFFNKLEKPKNMERLIDTFLSTCKEY